MSETEELKQRMEHMLLQQKIERLQRKARREAIVGAWSWGWVAPLALIGLFFAWVGVEDQMGMFYYLLPITMLVPAAAKALMALK